MKYLVDEKEVSSEDYKAKLWGEIYRQVAAGEIPDGFLPHEKALYISYITAAKVNELLELTEITMENHYQMIDDTLQPIEPEDMSQWDLGI